jgi:hypothetical protein
VIIYTILGEGAETTKKTPNIATFSSISNIRSIPSSCNPLGAPNNTGLPAFVCVEGADGIYEEMFAF